MKKKVFYWSPCLNAVGTIKSTLNSAIALSKYSKDHKVFVINSCGEWNDYRDIFSKNSIELIDLKFNYFKYLPKTGFIGSRLSYFIIFILSVNLSSIEPFIIEYGLLFLSVSILE